MSQQAPDLKTGAGPNTRGLELAKWIALVSMTVDHVGKFVDPSLYEVTNIVGRLAYPLFAWIIGMRLAGDPGRSKGYFANLVTWGLISQPIYVLVGKGWADPNIFFTLALGVGAFRGLEALLGGRRTIGAFVFLACGVAAVLVDYGVAGVLIIPVVATLATRSQIGAALIVGPLGVLGNLIFTSPYVGPGAVYALAASVVAILCLQWQRELPRLPKQAFYAYYPGHLLALYLFVFAARPS